MCFQARLEDSGKYLCWVNNTAGEETIQVSLTVTGMQERITEKMHTSNTATHAHTNVNARTQKYICSYLAAVPLQYFMFN